VADCDRSGVQHCAVVPNFASYRADASGGGGGAGAGALRRTLGVDGRPTSYAVVGDDRRLLLVKDVASPVIQVVYIYIYIVILYTAVFYHKMVAKKTEYFNSYDETMSYISTLHGIGGIGDDSSTPSISLFSPSLLRSVPLIQLGSLGDRRKLPSGPGGACSPNAFKCILSQKVASDCKILRNSE